MLKNKANTNTRYHNHTLRNLAGSIVVYEKVTTTKTKAKAIIPVMERMINIAKKNTLSSRRSLLAYFMYNKNIVNKIIKDIAHRFENSKSGFMIFANNKPRLGDGAPMSTIILTKSKFLNTLKTDKSEKDQKNQKNKLNQKK